MAEHSLIAWCDHSFSGWVGCTKVSPACDHCYAEHDNDTRFHRVQWGPHAPRRRAADSTWGKPLSWQKKAAEAGIRRRVFAFHYADVFDNHAPPEWRIDFWSLIAKCPDLDWMLLTKRPQNIAGMLPEDWGDGWPNVWLGTTTENQTEAARRIPHLLAIPAPVHFLSVEPMLEPVDLGPWLDRIDWVICGGESGVGEKSRPMQPAWVRALHDQVQAKGAAFFMKQTGSNRELWPGVRHRSGTILSEWPADLQIQEFPVRGRP